MATRRRRFTAEFKQRVALDALRGDHTIQAVAAKHQVHPSQVSNWKREVVEGTEGGVRGPGLEAREGSRIEDSGSACEDRRVDGGAEFVSARVAALSRSECLRMVERDGELSWRQQCRFEGVPFSWTVY